MAQGDSNFTNLVASGMVTAGSVAMGGATTGGKQVGSLTDSSSTASGTVQSTEYTLNSVILPANSFNANTRSLTVYAWGTTAANANAKDLKIYFGGTAVATVSGSTANAKPFFVVLHVVRTGSSTQSAVAQIWIDTATSPTIAVNNSLAITDTAAITVAVKSANTAAAAASATGKGMVGIFTN